MTDSKQQQAIPIYRADGKTIIGAVTGGVFRKSARSSVHQLHRPPAWACDVASLEAARAAGAVTVEIADRDTGATYRAPLSDFYSVGISVNRQHGAQLALPLGRWSVTGGRVSTSARSGSNPPSSGPSQLSLL